GASKASTAIGEVCDGAFVVSDAEGCTTGRVTFGTSNGASRAVTSASATPATPQTMTRLVRLTWTASASCDGTRGSGKATEVGD
ncbi:MAG: hypothetical protein ACK46I_16230, partial [Phycisphaerae bacterium]